LSNDDNNYRRPPRATQFKPGQSGNPTGKNKGTRNIATELEEILSEQVSKTSLVDLFVRTDFCDWCFACWSRATRDAPRRCEQPLGCAPLTLSQQGGLIGGRRSIGSSLGKFIEPMWVGGRSFRGLKYASNERPTRPLNERVSDG
jgi:Family of unknown function (DUF5681)